MLSAEELEPQRQSLAQVDLGSVVVALFFEHRSEAVDHHGKIQVLLSDQFTLHGKSFSQYVLGVVELASYSEDLPQVADCSRFLGMRTPKPFSLDLESIAECGLSCSIVTFLRESCR